MLFYDRLLIVIDYFTAVCILLLSVCVFPPFVIQLVNYFVVIKYSIERIVPNRLIIMYIDNVPLVWYLGHCDWCARIPDDYNAWAHSSVVLCLTNTNQSPFTSSQ